FERWRELAPARELLRATDRLFGRFDQLVRDLDPRALMVACEVDLPRVALVPMLPEQQDMNAELRALRQVRSLRQRGPLAALVLDCERASPFDVDHVELGCDTHAFRAQPY